MDTGISLDPVESFKLFQGRIKDQYDKMARSEQFVTIDATRSIHETWGEVHKVVQEKLSDYEPPSGKI
jgi:dTMP kinase